MRQPKQPSVMPAMRDWYMRNVAPTAQPVKVAKPAPVPKVKTPVTESDSRALAAIQRVTFCPATNPKRFARQMAGAIELTEAQRDYLWDIVWTFRRQVADKNLVKLASERKAKAI